jgi:uncharacterized protein (DUF302 family)
MAQETFPSQNADGLITLSSPYSVAETLDRLEAVLRNHGVTIFARIDHAAAAQDAGLSLRPTQVLIFGNPNIGTPVMQAAPTIAIDLPFKVLAWEDETGQVWLSYNSTEYLAQRHRLDIDTIQPLSAIAKPIKAALQAE